MRVRLWLTASLTVLLVGCSQRAAYDTLKASGRSHAECEKIRDLDKAKRCDEAFTKPYDVYTRQRREVLSATD